VQIPEPILAIYESAGKSVHALIRTNAKSKAEFDEIADEYEQEYAPYGADPAVLTAVRSTRLPNVVRGDNGRCQRLLYLNPGAIAEPIWSRKLRNRRCAIPAVPK
jgi:hypothetical protein